MVTGDHPLIDHPEMVTSTFPQVRRIAATKRTYRLTPQPSTYIQPTHVTLRRVILADSGALRVRRARAHKAGDHSLCRRCAAVRGEAGVPETVTLLGRPPDVPELDPAAEMRRLAARLASAHESDPSNAIVAAELRKTLLELMPKGKPDADADLTGLFSALQA